MSHPLVVNVRAGVGARWDVYVGRGRCPCPLGRGPNGSCTHGPTGWGNPFSVESHGAGAMDLYVEHLIERVMTQPGFNRCLDAIKGKILGCWCAPASCHADVLAQLANVEGATEAARLQLRLEVLGATGPAPAARPWRALTIIQPWAWLIAIGAKRVENRTWAPPSSWRGPLLIHAGKAPVMDLSPELRAMPWPRGAGVTGYTLGEQLDRMSRRGEHVVGHVVAIAEHVLAAPIVRAEQDPFAFGPVCWWLDGVRALERPVPARGAQGLWTPAPDVVAQVEAQLAAVTRG